MNIHSNFRLDRNITNTKIFSSGVYLPDEIAISDHIFQEFRSEEKYGIPEDWMSETMGIIERRVSNENQTPSDLAVLAAQQALDSCDEIDKDDIGMVLFCGIERDQPEPATAHTVQRKLGLNASLAFDIANACFGFIDGLRIAENFIKAGSTKYVLICTGEIPTRLTKNFVSQLKAGMPVEKAKKILGFLSVGDAGAAMILGPSDSAQGFQIFATQSNSHHHNKCFYKHNADGSVEGQMKMAQIVAKTYRMQESLIKPTMNKLGWETAEFLLTHQVGKKSFDQVADAGVVPKDKMIKSYDLLGNITSATFAVNHHQLSQRDDLNPGDRVYCCYSGSGIVIGQFGYTL